MTLFAVIALKDTNEQLDQAVADAIPSPDAYKIEPGKWVVNSDVTTAKELSEKLGIRAKISHLVLPLRGYSGRAQPDLWEWLSAQSEKTNA